MATPLTVEQYAQLRKVTRQSVEKAIRTGRIEKAVTSRRPVMVDPYIADREWADNTRSAASAQQRRPAGDDPAPDDPNAPNLNRAKARKAEADADLAELSLQKARGDVVSIVEARALWFKHWRSLRDRIMAISDRESAQLCGVTDPAQMRIALDAILRQALDDLPESPPAVT